MSEQEILEGNKLPEVISDEWRVDKIEIEYQTWGEKKGRHIGKIRFKNKHYESFEFIIKPEHIDKYLVLIKEQLILSSVELTNDLIQKLNF